MRSTSTGAASAQVPSCMDMTDGREGDALKSCLVHFICKLFLCFDGCIFILLCSVTTAAHVLPYVGMYGVRSCMCTVSSGRGKKFPCVTRLAS
ncbi:hypothetical protein BDBG_17298 [Blastomyces gilchristii SLH14081]|uniref:Uncharacterized protein n=1 Tax=Blastomyces gilchristii (strain SLH14081) TaxID=559298 RepID=A0A179UPK9_BLAGS|nr:uncharacterized protein BDBG_17298 [Blastomyces gilchristii SLH14081]OAT10015.1 hypothetical protein BDBG_17298 [Blastomyces gilchristii SLH14081]